MQEYKSVSKYLGKQKSEFRLKDFFKKVLIKTLICILLLLIGLITLRIDKKSNQVIYKFIYETNFNFAKVNEWYQKYFGDILPFQKESEKDIPVFDEELIYKNLSVYKEGISLEVGTDYLIPVLENGIVIFIGNKDNYGNTVIIQQTDGVNIWYGNITNVNFDLYDYVSKGEFLGSAQGDNIYLVAEKEGEYLDYKDYFK